MSGQYRLRRSFNRFDKTVSKSVTEYPANLGLTIGGQKLVEVPSRPGYYYVRIRGDLNETAVAYNNGKVSPIYDLPVLIMRHPTDKNRWVITGRDIGRYQNWGSSAYLPNHGAQHSLNPFTPGADPVWVWDRQFMPVGSVPSGSSGAGNVIIQPGPFYISGERFYVGQTGTADIVGYKPTGTSARMVLVYLDSNGNPALEPGSVYFDASITGSVDVHHYTPQIPGTLGVPSAAIRLVSGTRSILWDNIYDVRPFFYNASGSASGHTIQDDGTPLASRPNLNFVGDGFSVYNDGSATIVSGTATAINVPETEIAYGAVDGLASHPLLTVQEDYGLAMVKMGVSGTTPQDYQLQVVSDVSIHEDSLYAAVGIMNFLGDDFTDTAYTLDFWASRGTPKNPSGILKDDTLLSTYWYGRGGSDYAPGSTTPFGYAKLIIVADDTFYETTEKRYQNTTWKFYKYGADDDSIPYWVYSPGLVNYKRPIEIVGAEIYLGMSGTTGTWKLTQSAGDLRISHYVSGSWVQQLTLLADGNTQIGDIANHNYTQFSPDGTLGMTGTATAFLDEKGQLYTARVTSPGSKIIFDEAEASFYFKDSATSSDYLSVNLQFNHDRAIGAPILPHFHWWQGQSGTPHWAIQYRWQAPGQPKATAWSNARWSNNAFSWVSGTICQISNFPAITPPAGDGVSAELQFRIIRDTNNSLGLFSGTSTITGDVYLYDFDAHKEINTLGSKTEYVK